MPLLPHTDLGDSMHIVVFNGPPQSGKDTMAELLAAHMDQQGVVTMVVPESLSLPLRWIAYAMTGYEGRRVDGPDYEEFKTTHFPAFNATGRQIMIDICERFLKPTYGIEIMANLLRARNENIGPAVLLIRDGGFQTEIESLVRWVGEDNLYVVNVLRNGTSFENDSREWIHHKHSFGCDNNGTLDDLATEAGRVYGRLVNQLGWNL